MSVRMLPSGQSREKGSFHPMDFLGPMMSGIGSLLKSDFGKKVLLPVVTVVVLLVAIGGVINSWKNSAIQDFSTKPRILNAFPRSVGQEYRDDGYRYRDKYESVIDCETEYGVSLAKKEGNFFLVNETAIYKMQFDLEGEGKRAYGNLRVAASQIVFNFDEKLQHPYITFSDMNSRLTESYFEEFYKNDPTAKAIIHCKRLQVPDWLLKAMGLAEADPERVEDR